MCGLALLVQAGGSAVWAEEVLAWEIDPQRRHQTIEGFGASDAWSAQFVGRWPDPLRERVAELLFSREWDTEGRPRGIGLSIWRFNVGAGSAEQGAESGIRDRWRRAECFQNADGLWDWSKQAGQQWFLEAARRHGVETFVAFVNSPPVHWTRNGRAWGDGGYRSNLDPERYEAFAAFLAEVCARFARTGRPFQFLSPVNEPQWNWSRRNGQEGCPWTNKEIRRLVPVLDAALRGRGLEVQIVLPESAKLDHLLQPTPGEPLASDQLRELYGDRSDAVHRVPRVAPVVAAHGYGTTDRRPRWLGLRRELGRRLQREHPGLRFWMSEYCILGQNDEGRLRGPGRDVGMTPALFVARVIHHDLTLAGATSWQWWLAISPYDYKDGLVYVGREPEAAEIRDSKLLWVLGYYARFVRPGSVRVEMRAIGAAPDPETDAEAPLFSAYLQPRTNSVVLVGVNPSDRERALTLRFADGTAGEFRTYLTTEREGENLVPGRPLRTGEVWRWPARSVVTCVSAEANRW